jgi:hypothetical protein
LYKIHSSIIDNTNNSKLIETNNSLKKFILWKNIFI